MAAPLGRNDFDYIANGRGVYGLQKCKIVFDKWHGIYLFLGWLCCRSLPFSRRARVERQKVGKSKYSAVRAIANIAIISLPAFSITCDHSTTSLLHAEVKTHRSPKWLAHDCRLGLTSDFGKFLMCRSICYRRRDRRTRD
jgi:hypothetical protein